MSMLVCESITKRYGSNIVMDNVSASIAKAELVTLLGPSGCGKTTLLRSIAGLVEVDAGRIVLAGKDVTRTPIHRRQIGMVFQSHALFPHMSVSDNVGFGLRMHGVAPADRRKRIAEALSLVRLQDYGERMPHQLSGGQQQRVAIARAIAINPSVLLLDEPFGALDRKLRDALQVELRILIKELSITAIFVTHDQEEAVVLSDRIAVMNGGVIQQIGTPSEIFENPSTHFVADFMGFQNFFDAKVRSVGPDGLRLENNAGQFLACDTTGAVVGDDVHIGLRAERMSIAPAASNAAAGPNSLRGTLIGSSYRGDFNVYSVETALGTFTVRAGAREDALSVGQMVVLGWTPSSLKILKRQ